MKILLNAKQIELAIKRMAHQVLEENPDPDATVFIGIQPRGTLFSNRLVPVLEELYGKPVKYGQLDITFYRDDVGRKLHIPNQTRIDFTIDKHNVVIIDDVLYTGRTIRSAMDALIDFGRPAKVELAVLIDRRFARELPIQPDFSGKTIDTIFSQRVNVKWQEQEGVDEVVLED
ncbi:MAG TPA: bifunctional pyr operon transcriptional regulator/uracil phosphoribosyltransferase PyrR [Phnomibacter sp.]|nr:bifunctional pyr operon transcriptional regulator/uracil phosphoribosyltransferase PyrR [Phnomibacter sp.]